MLKRKLKSTFFPQLLLMSATFLLVIISHQRVTATSLSEINKDLPSFVNPKINLVAQVFKSLNLDSNYYQKMAAADNFYKQGNLVKVEEIQREVKPDFAAATKPNPAIGDISQLSPTSQEYWLAASKVIEQNPEKKKTIKKEILEPLKSLVEESPDFVPGHIALAETYFTRLSKEKDGIKAIEKAAQLYPGRDDVLDKKIEFLLSERKPLEASIAAREFAYSYPDFHRSPQYKADADKYSKRYQDNLKTKIGITTVAGGAGEVATGNVEGGLQLGQILLTGESAAGQSFAESYKSELSMVSDAEKLRYVNDIGQKLAKLMGRDEFTYEFNIVDDPSPNAFALPGGKIFMHTGALQLMDSEAELAGVLAHEVAHSVLSHGYQKIANSAVTNAGTSFLSDMVGSNIGSTALQLGNVLLNKKFSRDKEKQADVVGLRVLDAAGYSADGLYNFMAKLSQLQGETNLVDSLLSSHPASDERMRYLEELIQNKGYNRYGYEGVETYQKMFPG